MTKRLSGIVLPIFSLPSAQGIGTFGRSAFDFVDFLKESGQSYWQILPLSPTGFGDSPYQSCSARAGNPYFIDLEILEEQGLLHPDDYRYEDFGQNPDAVDYGALYRVREQVLRRAHKRSRARLANRLAAFRAENADWLGDYALFMALKKRFGMLPLKDWPDEAVLNREPAALTTYRHLLGADIEFYEFVQLLFFEQWRKLKAYANENGVSIIGDVPIYAAEDSVEVWAEGGLFQLSAPGIPAKAAGVPPDLYSATGQLWGNPLYDWARHEKDGFAWWIARLKHSARFFDVIRIDHFRGFYNYWEVAAGSETAIGGRWVTGPGMRFIGAIRAALPETELIAEDLGDLEPEVVRFIESTGLPGMSVLLYGFDPEGDSPYLGHNIPKHRVAYTSTHDSPTFAGWLYGEANEAERSFAENYLRLHGAEGIGWGAVKSAMATAAQLTMFPLQDVLGLGADARINTPSTLGGQNWRWRVRAEALNGHVAALLRKAAETYRRLPPVPLVNPTQEPAADGFAVTAAAALEV